MDKLIIPTGDPKNIQTIAEVCARLKVAAKATYDVVALPESFEKLDLPEGTSFRPTHLQTWG